MNGAFLKGVTRLLAAIGLVLSGAAAHAADLQVSQYSSSPDPVAVPATATFTVVVGNNASAAVANAVVTISIPSTVEVLATPGSFPSNCVLSGAVASQTLTCTIASLAGGGAPSAQTITYTAVARTAGSAPTTASITAAGNVDNNPGNDSLTITPTVRGGADLRMTKTGSSANVIAGGTLQYTLTAYNDGPSTTSAVRVVDNLPAASDFQYQSFTGSGWACALSGTAVTCNYSGAAPALGAAYPALTITGRVTKATSGTISNIASVTLTDPLLLDPNGANNNSNTVVTNVQGGSDMQAIKSMPSTIVVGASGNIVLSIRNNGPQNAPAGSTITDTIDAALTIGALPANCARNGQTVTCTAGAIAASQQTTFTIPVTGAAATPAVINNTAQITVPASFGDPNLTNNSVIAPFQVVLPNADLQLRTKTKTPNPVAPGANITSAITVRNLGPSVASYSPANPIRVTDTLGPNETFVSVVGTAWSCSAAGTVVTCETIGTGTLGVNGNISLNLITQAGAGTDAIITNTACTDRTAGSAHTPSSVTSPTANDCLAAGTRSTTSAADLSIAKDMSLSPTSGWTENLAVSDTDSVFYIRLTAWNAAGSDTARTVRVTDAIPNLLNAAAPNITVVAQESATAGSMTYNAAGGLVTWTFSDLAGGASETLVIRVTRPFESGSFTNFASIFSPDTTELNSNNNTDSANYSVAAIADMTINSKTVTPNPSRVGVASTYVISVRNAGANSAENVQVIDVIDPARFEIIGTPTTTKPGATCSVVTATGTVTCNMGTFARTEVRQINVNVMPRYPFGSETLSTLPVTQVNRATVTTSTRDSNGGSDPNSGNNFFALNHPINPPTFDLAVTKTESDPVVDDPIRFDETLNYDVRVSNFGPSRASDVVVTDLPNPPAGLTMTLSSVEINPVAANGGLTLQAAPNAGCTASGANYVCKIDQINAAANNLDPSRQVIFRMKFTIAGAAPTVATTFSNAVQVTSAEQPVWNGAGADVQTGNNRAIQNTTVRPATDLEIVSKTRGGALERAVDEPIEFTIRWRNNGPSAAARVNVTDTLPAGFALLASPAPSTSIPAGSYASVSGLDCTGTTTVVCVIDGSFPPGATELVDLKLTVRAVGPYTGPISPTDVTNSATITIGTDAGGVPLSEDSNPANNTQTAVVQIRPASIAGVSYADNNDNGAIDPGEGTAGVTITLTGTDTFGNPVNRTAVTDANGAFVFNSLAPSNAAGYTLVETQPTTHYDLNETAGTAGGTVDNSSYGNAAAQNTIAGIVLPATTDATGYIFQNHLRAVIVADDDNPAPVNGLVGQTNIINAFANDTLNGNPVTPAQIVATIVTPPSNAGVTMDPATGDVSVAAGTPAGTYTIDYRICDAAEPTNCDPARVTVIVNLPAIVATNDSVTGMNSLTGGTNVLNALDGDTLNGAPATTATVTIALAPGATVPAGLTFDAATGNTSVAPGTPAGTYAFNYRICDRVNPTNCADATETVTVVAPAIVAIDDSAGPISGIAGGTNVMNALTGDTLNGVPATTATITIALAPGATVPAGLTFDTATGNVSVAPGTPAGSYSFNYRICDRVNPTNCADATETVTVLAAPIDAIDDSVTGINGTTGATNVLNVLGADTLDGAAATLANVSLTLATGSTVPAGITFDPATGNVSVNPGTPAGSYSFNYTICERLNPTNCDTATATVTVQVGTLAAVNDSATGINGRIGANDVLNVLTGDTLNGDPATTANVTIAVAAGSTVPTGLTFDPATGSVSVVPGTPAGTYSFDYTICERLNPTNCRTATATVTVLASSITADDDASAPISSIGGGTGVVNSLDGDTLNGAPAVLADIVMSVVTPATPINGGSVPVLDPATGLVNVAPGTPAGTYTIRYRICERLNPTNCAEAVITVPVVADPIIAVSESVAGVNGATGGQDVLNALTGDTLNGQPVTPATVTIAVAAGSTVPAGLTFDTATGNVSVAPGTPAGTYTFNYTICERLNPTNCATATDTVTVIAPVIRAIDDRYEGVNSAIGAANVVNAFSADTLDGQPATPANTTVALATGFTMPAGLTFDPATGNVSVAPGTAPGTYVIPYRLCDRINPTNCADATMTVTVIPANGGVSGIVYLDGNRTRTHEAAERLLQNWVVELVRNGEVVARTVTDANGFYSITDMPSGSGYSIRFRHPTSGVVYSRIESVTLPNGGILPNQDLPIMPTGVVYDAVSRQPVAGARVTLTDASGAVLPTSCFVDPTQASQVTGPDGYYQFNIVAGADARCPVGRTDYRIRITAPSGYADPESTVLAARPGAFNPAGRGNPAPVVSGPNAPQVGEDTTYYLAFQFAQGDGDVTNNHIPLDPFVNRTALLVSKVADRRTASVGDLVTYTITVRNTEAAQRAAVTVVDILPPGLRYVPGTASVDGVANEPVVDNRELRWINQTIPGNTTLTYRIMTAIGTGVTQGDRVNTALARRSPTGPDTSNRAQAVVTIVASSIFDCAEVIGKVFDDRNGNGYQDEGEPGIPAARLATVNGQLVTADEYGRYHITCAAVPDAQIGSNFVLKLDTRTVPDGYTPTHDNPQSIRLTRGKISELNFGVQRAMELAVDADRRAFAADSAAIAPEFARRLDALRTDDERRLVIRLTYHAAADEPEALVGARLDALREQVRAVFAQGWDGPAPVVEAATNRLPGAGESQ